MAQPTSWANPITTRSKIVLEIASELVGYDWSVRQAKVLLKSQGRQSDWALSLFGSGTLEGIDAVIDRSADLAIVNPSTLLTLAYRGMGPYTSPQPVRVLAVIPSLDQFIFAVDKKTGLKTFEEIATRRYPLKVSVRGISDHGVNVMLNDIAAAAGFTLAELRSWGGEIREEGPMPWPDGPKFEALARGEIDAIFDEAADVWGDKALDCGMTLLPLAEATVVKLEAMGYRRALLSKSVFPRLAADILTIDFSGWPIFVHADLADARVTQICAALEARKHLIPWQGDGPLPLERMCRDMPETPIDVPLHAAAERFWRERGYLA
ncbi:MAG: hypothetical protein EXR27_15890 [Betaproteobacteria bacterium]|nr:hypothetical protein [Betaproteobacteria bacterium]